MQDFASRKSLEPVGISLSCKAVLCDTQISEISKQLLFRTVLPCTSYECTRLQGGLGTPVDVRAFWKSSKHLVTQPLLYLYYGITEKNEGTW